MGDRHFFDARGFLLLGLLFLGLASPPSSAQDSNITTTRLTAFESPQGLVEEAKLSPDGSRVVYRASQESWGTLELYSVPVTGGDVTKLSQPLVTGGDVLELDFSPDGQHVVFRADAEVDEKVELYRVPIDGGAAAKINGLMVPAGDVEQFLISPDQRFIVYTATQEHFQKLELYGHDLETGSITKLSPPLEPSREVFELAISPDSANAVYLVGGPYGACSPCSLYSTPISGGAVVLLEVGGAQDFMITADSQQVLYSTLEVDAELRSVAVTGGSSTAVLPPSYDIDGPLLAAPDRSTIVFLGDFEDENSVLFALDVESGTARRISPAGTDPAIGVLRDPIYLSPDGATVFFCTFPWPSGPKSMRAAPLAGGPAVSFHDRCIEPELSGDGSRAAWRVGDDQVMAVSSDGLAPARILVSVDVPAGFDGIRSVHLDPTGSHVIFTSDHLGPPLWHNIYSVPWQGGEPVLLNATLGRRFISGSRVEPVHAVEDFLLFGAQRETAGLAELYRSGLTGGAVTKLSGPMTGTGGSTRFFDFTPDGSKVVFTADLRDGAGHELWRHDVVAGGPPAPLSDGVAGLVDFSGTIRVDSTGSRVAFTATVEPEMHALRSFSVPIDGGPATLLSDPADEEPANFDLTGSGQWFYYVLRNDDLTHDYRRGLATGGPVGTFASGLARSVLSPGRQRLAFQAPGDPWQTVLIEGGSPVELAPASAETVIFSPDGTRVVYWIDQGFGELYSVSSAGGAATRLHDSSSPCNGSSDQNLLISSAGGRVVFWCGGSQYSVPIDGGPVVLLTPFRMEDMTTSSDGSVLYGTRDGFELVSVPMLGGAVTELASFPAPFDFFGDPVVDVTSAPGDAWVFVRVGMTAGESNYNLWAVPSSGGEPVQFNEANTAVGAFDFSADGSRILFLQGLRRFLSMTDVRTELVSRPVAGGELFRYTPEMPLGGQVHRFAVQGPSVLYTADLEQDGVRDLYLAIESDLFADGFESGDASAWSSSSMP